MPGSFNVFFKTGVLAWNGLVAFYIPVAVFATWLVVNSWMLSRAVDHQLEEERSTGDAGAGNGHPQDTAAMAAEIAQLRTELERVSARVG